MAMSTSLRTTVRMASVDGYEEAVKKLAEKARGDPATLDWVAYQAIHGPMGTYFFARQFESWKAIIESEPTAAMVRRLFPGQTGMALMEQLNEGMVSIESVVLQDRPELGYPADERDQPAPFLRRTRITVRPGGNDACEELLRKVAEAVPKVDDPVRFSTTQLLVGDLHQYGVVSPIDDPGELDAQRRVPDLLNGAFGPDEGGLIWRAGRDAIAAAYTDIWMYRADLSNRA